MTPTGVPTPRTAGTPTAHGTASRTSTTTHMAITTSATAHPRSGACSLHTARIPLPPEAGGPHTQGARP